MPYKDKEIRKLKQRIYQKEYVLRNHGRVKQISMNSYLKHRERISLSRRKYYANNIEKYRAYYERNYEKRKMQYYLRAMERKVHVLLATPSWVNKKEIYDIYAECRTRSLIQKTLYHVDHIYPLRNKNLCGLHVSWNLRIITAKENLSKNNKVLC